MRLAEVRIKGFRKLVDTNCRFPGKLTAIVGPNEAGKSSLLELLKRGRTSGVVAHLVRPRGLDLPDDEKCAEFWYRLDEEDIAAIGTVDAVETPEWYVVAKFYEGKRTHWTVPALTRDQSARRVAQAALARFVSTKAATQLERNDEEDGLGDLLDRVASLIDGTSELNEDQWGLIDKVARELAEGSPPLGTKAAEKLRIWREGSSGERPRNIALNALDAREPTFAEFDDEQRRLASSYTLSEEVGDPAPALRNLAALAGLDLEALHRAFANDDPGAIETAIEAANSVLHDRLNEAWHQSVVNVHIRLDGDTLRVLVHTDDAPGYSQVAERSDGLKTFVALTAFAHRVSTAPRSLILLVDEAEQHLHYDAQADLVRMLDRQSLASQVIYTTHSAGCLPADLGTGVRAIRPESQGRSRVVNSFWEAGPGFTPLVMALGASVTAFAPSRYAVICEGATEMLLLPSMIREALGDETGRLDYQVAPGLAEVGNSSLRELELEAPRVAYVVDGDAGGAAHAARLLGAGVPANRVIHLGGQGSDLTLEDLLRDDSYLQGLNAAIAARGGATIPKSELAPAQNRELSIKNWFDARGAQRPGKPQVALAILENRERQILTAAAKRVLRKLHKDIQSALELPTS